MSTHEIKIGPYLTVHNHPDYVPNLIDAIMADNEHGAHWLNNEASEKLRAEWPTLIAMANIIEKQRDAFMVGIDALIMEVNVRIRNESGLESLLYVKTRLKEIMEEAKKI